MNAIIVYVYTSFIHLFLLNNFQIKKNIKIFRHNGIIQQIVKNSIDNYNFVYLEVNFLEFIFYSFKFYCIFMCHCVFWYLLRVSLSICCIFYICKNGTKLNSFFSRKQIISCYATLSVSRTLNILGICILYNTKLEIAFYSSSPTYQSSDWQLYTEPIVRRWCNQFCKSQVSYFATFHLK